VEINKIIKTFLDADIELKKQRESWSKSAKLKEQAKIKRLRENDKNKKEAIDKELTDEVTQKKKDIRKNQKKELHIK